MWDPGVAGRGPAQYTGHAAGTFLLAVQPYPSSFGTFRTRIYMVVSKLLRLFKCASRVKPTPVRSLSVELCERVQWWPVVPPWALLVDLSGP